MIPRFYCVVCGYKTLGSEHDWSICPICFWEDDVAGDIDTASPANQGMWISEAQANFVKFGAVSERHRDNVRPPTKNDVRRPDFKPFPVKSRPSRHSPLVSLPPRLPKKTEKYLKERIVLILTPIDDYIANMTIAQILFLDMENKREPIHLFVNSPGGYVSSCLAIYDTVSRREGAPIYTYGLRQVSGMAALIVAGGASGHRSCLPDSRFMLVAVSGGKGKEEEAIEIPRLQGTIEAEFAKVTGQKPNQLHQDMIEERGFDARAAVAYGLVDQMVDHLPGPGLRAAGAP
jgi:ATP-dependent Clp protease, protease subunit